MIVVTCGIAGLLALADVRAAQAGGAVGGPAREDGGCVALTFDDGPDSVLTPRLLDILERKGVRATFFVVGRNVAAAPGIVGRASADGNEIGNHTYDHRLLTSLTAAEAIDEIALTDKAVIAETGVRPRLIRPPYGIIGVEIADLLRRHGLMRTIALWDVDSFDWLHEDGAETLATAGAAAPGSVVLLHDIHAGTVGCPACDHRQAASTRTALRHLFRARILLRTAPAPRRPAPPDRAARADGPGGFSQSLRRQAARRPDRLDARAWPVLILSPPRRRAAAIKVLS